MLLANAAGFWGDNLDAARRTLERADVDYLTLEYLAELTMSILAVQKRKNPALGYAGDFLTVLDDVVPFLLARPQLKIVTNAGGINPRACVKKAAESLVAAGLGELRIAMVDGDDLLPRMEELRAAGCAFVNLDTGRPLSTLARPIVAANAYLGAAGIATALAERARLVVTGRVADASLTLGPALHEFGWRPDDWEHLAGASVAGHLVECGANRPGACPPLGANSIWPTSGIRWRGWRPMDRA
ncbi:MAG: DUF1446 domain-containing protein [Pirellulales bacterium]